MCYILYDVNLHYMQYVYIVNPLVYLYAYFIILELSYFYKMFLALFIFTMFQKSNYRL